MNVDMHLTVRGYLILCLLQTYLNWMKVVKKDFHNKIQMHY